MLQNYNEVTRLKNVKKKKSLSSLMVATSAFALTSLYAVPVFAQVVINCATALSIGTNAQCSSTATLVINPDGSTNVTTGCLVNTVAAKAGRCVVNTGGVPVTKSVKVDFAKTFIDITNGGKQVRMDNFKMQHTATVPAASKFTFSPTDISNTVTLDIGATANITADQALGTYSGDISVRANTI